MKLVRILVIALGLLTIAATASFAAVPFITTSTVNQMAPNAQTGQAGTIRLTALAGGTVSAGEIILVTFSNGFISSLSDFQVTMTASGATGTTSVPVTVYNAATNIPGLPGPPTVKVTNNTILITFPAAVTFVAGDAIQIIGTRLDVSASAVVGGSLNATITSVLGSATVSNPTVQVATFVEPISVTTSALLGGAVAQITTAGTTTVTPATVKVTELFTNAFETKGATATAETQLILRVSNIPAGVLLTAATINAGQTSATVTASIPATGAITQTGNQAFVTVLISAQDSTLIESIGVNLTFTLATGATLPLPVGTATVAATLGPPLTTTPATSSEAFKIANNIAPVQVGIANNPLRYAPRFVPSPEANVLQIVQLTTQLLAVFNSWIPGAFDTGFAIANTTGFNTSLTQPFGNLGAQAGIVTAILYPADGSASKTVVTSATVLGGTGGLDANGQIPPHGMWTVLLSQLATQAGFTTGFTGQVYFVVNASNAHGVNYIADSNFTTQAQGYAMLVVPAPRTLGFENLDH